MLEEYEKRSQYYLPLIKECGWTAKEIQNKELLKFCLKVTFVIIYRNAQMMDCIEINLFVFSIKMCMAWKMFHKNYVILMTLFFSSSQHSH